MVRFERLGLFAPVFRVRTPGANEPPFHIPLRKGNNWFRKRLAWDTTEIPPSYEIPSHLDRTQEGYYSVFQLDYLNAVLQGMTLHVKLDAYLDRDKEDAIDWTKNSGVWMRHAEGMAETLRTHEYRRGVSFLCQYISNWYYPRTQGDQRTIQIGAGSFLDRWISINGHGWNWHEKVKDWKPQTAERLFDLTPEKLRHAYDGLAGEQEHCDPLQHWYQLMQFISVRERARLKGDALRAETLRSAAHMLRFLHRDLYGEELPHPNEVTGTIIVHVPELAVRQDARHYLEFVVNRFGLNPQPKLALIVEGQSEERAVEKIFERYFGAHHGIYGIEIIVLGGVDNATGAREDRFRAILRLVDYLHHHQTLTYVILDNENYAKRLKEEAKRAKSIHGSQRYVTRPGYIRIWKDSFEFDNFSCSEIAAAMSIQAQGHTTFTSAEVAACRKAGQNPGSNLQGLYKQKACYGLNKVRLSENLVEIMMSQDSEHTIQRRPIVKTLEHVARLAARNLLPAMSEVWERNQVSKYFGKKRKPPQCAEDGNGLSGDV
ncbi:MAG: hypothetical protein KF693_10205 [Nitrospira sp.]|nr:hypothetical protein [Nitrospira sp.]